MGCVNMEIEMDTEVADVEDLKLRLHSSNYALHSLAYEYIEALEKRIDVLKSMINELPEDNEGS